jgi:dienelactone hydrolase
MRMHSVSTSPSVSARPSTLAAEPASAGLTARVSACVLAASAWIAVGCGDDAPPPPPADGGLADAPVDGAAPPLPCETDAPQVAGTAATDAFADARARCGMPAYRWSRDPSLGEVVSRAPGERFTPETLASLVAAAGGTLPPGSDFRVRTETLVYVTQDRGRLLRSSAVVAYPERLTESRRFDVLLLLHGTSGFTRDCGPTNMVESRALAAALASYGYVVVEPDYLGLERRGLPGLDPVYDGLHPYLVGEATALASLDAVRAARRLLAGDDGYACTTARVGLFGASQGGHAALWVERLAPYYARELTLVGGVAAVPATDVLAHAARGLSSVNSATPFFAAMLTVMPPWYGDTTALSSLLAPSVVDVIPEALATRCNPGGAVTAPGSLEGIFAREFLDAVERDGLGATDPWGCMVRDNDLLATSVPRIASAEPGYGLLFVVGERDELIVPEIERPAFTALCARDLPLRYLECRGAGHAEAVFWSVPEILAFLRARFAGEALTGECALAPAVRCAGTPASTP